MNTWAGNGSAAAHPRRGHAGRAEAEPTAGRPRRGCAGLAPPELGPGMPCAGAAPAACNGTALAVPPPAQGPSRPRPPGATPALTAPRAPLAGLPSCALPFLPAEREEQA
ncbi:unnamed protein product [Urochloa humidicola]